MAALEIAGLNFETETGTFKDIPDVDYFQLTKYLKRVYRSKDKFINEFVNELVAYCNMYDCYDYDELIKSFIQYYDLVEPYTYAEAFKINDNFFKSVVFGSIDVGSMIKELGSTMIKVEGMPVKHKIYDHDGENWHWEEYDVIYELHHVDVSQLGVNDELPVVKCWCTSTNKEHWLWVDEKFKNGSPLEAIASTCVVYENMLPHIKEIKRHGDVFLFEMDEEVIPSGNLVPLTKDQYFSLLTAQS